MMVREMAAVARQLRFLLGDFAFRLLDSLFEVTSTRKREPSFQESLQAADIYLHEVEPAEEDLW
jgi:hypothetical protein